MFQTKIKIDISEFNIDYSSKILTLGSCFSENIGSKLQTALFNIDINPFGILFNPVSISNSINYIISNKQFTESELINTGSLWGSFTHSTLFSDVLKATTLNNINKRLSFASENIKSNDILIITFGTAWVYKHKKSSEIVANCHKIQPNEFERIRLTANEIATDYSQLINKLNSINPNLRIIFTVSPVRHIKDGATENNISKGILLQAVQEIVKTYDNCSYFPAYEIQLDELRDYRFYANDLLHPSDLAIEYIFEQFNTAFFNSETKTAYTQILSYKNDLAHRPIHPKSIEYQKFIESTEKKKESLIIKYPFLKDRL